MRTPYQSRHSRSSWGRRFRLPIFLPFLAGTAFASTPIRDGCSEDAGILATIQPTDPIQIRHAVNGEATACYSVVIAQAGKEIQGFILGSTLPAIQEFERTRAKESRIAIPVSPVAQQEKKPSLPPIGPSFEPWAGVDTKGHRLQISPGDAKVTLVTFWAAQSSAARRLVENLKKTEGEFRPKGLRSFGMIESSSASRANYYLEDMGLDSPQSFDRQSLASKYNADPVKGTTLVVDAANNVVAISSSPAEIRAAVARLLSSE